MIFRRQESNHSIAAHNESTDEPPEFDALDLEDDKNSKSWRKDCLLRPQEAVLVSIFVLVGLSLTLVKFMDAKLPTPSPGGESLNSSQFNEDLARKDLEDLTSVGIRVSGSEATDVTTVHKLMSILTKIKNFTAGNYNLEVDIQKPSWAIHSNGYADIYLGISNVIAKLEANDANLRTNSSVLVNCHFDSVPGSPGATDDMISCAAMLEVLRLTYRSSGTVLRNPIVFLFNGAEETGLRGSHGFLSDHEGKGHPWSWNLRCFVNLEGSGAGGREMLFQTGGGWIMEAYAKAAKHPYGSVVGEEIFRKGLTSSGTDFSVFTYDGKLPGLDMAFIKRGWLYHTKWDKVTEIPPGSIQHMGDNLLGLVQHLGGLRFDEVVDEDWDNKMVFFDLFGLYMVRYTEIVGIIIHVAVAISFIIITITEVRPNTLRRCWTILMLFVSTVVLWSAAVGIAMFSGALMNWTGYYRPYHSYPFLAVVLFGVPAIFAQSLVQSVFWKGSQRKSWLAGKFSLAILLLCVSYTTRSAYVLAIVLGCAVLAWVPRRLVFDGYKGKLYGADVALNLICSELVPFIYTCNATVTLMDVFIPILGRSGPGLNPNIYMGVLASASTAILAFHGISSYFVSCRRINLVLGLLGSTFVINPLLVIGFIGKIPFQETTPMRIWLLDTDRTWYNADMTENKTDAGYWFWPLDPNTLDYLPEISKTIPSIRDFEILDIGKNSCPDLYCSQPLAGGTLDSMKKIPWVRKPSSLSLDVKNLVQMRIRNIGVIGPGLRNVSLAFEGPSDSFVAIQPAPNWAVINWTLSSQNGTVVTSMRGYSRLPTYILSVEKGYSFGDFLLTVILEEAHRPNGTLTQKYTGELMNVLLVGHFVYDNFGWNFKDFVNKFPSWTNVQYWTSVVKQFKITA